MSLLIIFFFVFVGLILLYFVRAYEHGYINEEDYEYKHIYKKHCIEAKISETAMTIFTVYITALMFAIIGFLAAGAFSWLKNGSWLTIKPELLINALSNNSIFKDILLKETSWVGIQELSTWYLQSNLAWTFLLTFIVLILFLIFTTD